MQTDQKKKQKNPTLGTIQNPFPAKIPVARNIKDTSLINKIIWNLL